MCRKADSGSKFKQLPSVTVLSKKSGPTYSLPEILYHVVTPDKFSRYPCARFAKGVIMSINADAKRISGRFTIILQFLFSAGNIW